MVSYFVPIITFAGKAVVLPLQLNLSCKYQTMVDVTDSVKHPNSLRYGIDYERKMFYNTGSIC
jgi:hypothetical protein